MCGVTETQSIPATGNHSWGGWKQTKAASCTAGGEESRKCSVCGKTETRATSALGHSWGGWSVTKAATCISEGKETRTCSRDGAKETRSTPRIAHSWGSWRTTREAACDRTGVEEHRCSVCGTTETREIQKIPHTYGEWTVEKEPTCSEEGKQTRVCQVCGYVDTQSIAKLPHTFGEWTVTLEPTCTAEGEHTHTCEVCGLEETEKMPMIPHDFGEWEIISPLTDFSIGIRERTCKVCGQLEHEETAPSGILRLGDRGEGVRDLQNALNEAGYDCGTADGIFGQKTEDAIKDFEQDLNKNSDGIGWPGLEKILIDGLEHEEDLRLSVKLVSDASWFEEGDTVLFEAVLENSSGMDIDEFTLYQMSEHDEHYPYWLGVFGSEKLAGGESRTITDLEYTISAADVAAGDVVVSFYVSGEGAGGKTLYSNQVDLGINTQAPGPELELFANEVAVLPFLEDAEFTVPVTLINHSAAPVALDEIFLDESIGSISKEPWMSELLTPEVPYQFAYTGKILFYEEGMPWAHRTLSAKVHDPESEEDGSTGAHIFMANRVEGPSVMLIADDTTGMGGDLGDIISLPLVAINNGTVDLKVTEISGNYPTDIAEYDPKYDTLFPAGEGFAFTVNVEVLPADAYMASQQDPSGPCFFDRFILLRAIPAEGGEELIDDELIMLWFNGAMPGLTLAMHQITPDQEIWSPDEGGHIADMEYSGIVKNTGERPLTVTNLHAWMYPETEAAFIVSSFDEPVLLNPGETHSFTAVLPISTDNITPGSASESVDGVIEVMFGMVGEDPVEGGAMTQTRYDSENITFTYKVRKDAYSWAPPSEEEAEETFDDSVFVLKNITSHSQVQGAYHTDLYGEGEEITYEISIQSIADEELYDVLLIDRIGGEETVVATLPQLNKEDGYLSFPYTYVVTAADVEAGEVENHAYATYRVGNSPERVTSYEDVAFASTIDMKVPDGEKSEDLVVTKTASGNPGESNGSYAADDEVTYLITVTNNSGKTIRNIEVVDEKSQAGTVGTIAELSPSMSETVNFVYTVTAADVANGKVQNVATAKWTAGNENRYAPSNICTISTLPSPMSIYKYDAGTSENPAGYQLSETIHYEITVTNNSEEMLNNLQVRDMKKSGDGIVGTIPTLPSGASETVGFDYTVTQADVDEGKVVNVAWIDLNDTTGNSTGYMTIYSNEVYIPTIHAPAEVSVFKSEETSSIDPAGYELHHTAQGLIGFTNHADEPLLNVDIYDLPNGDTAGTYLGTIPQIDPGQQLYLPWGMTVTLEDVERGYMTNAARVEFTDPYTGEPRTEFADEITIKVKPLETVYGGLEVVKSVTNTPANGSYFVEGEEIAFHIDVKNLSGQKVTDLTVYEPLVSGGILKEVGELADGDSVSGIDVSWTVTALDVANGEVNNVVTVHAMGEDGTKYIVLSNPAIAPVGADEPELSDTPDEPKASSTPEGPDIPEEPGTPEEPGAPEEPGVPEEPGAPEEPGQPGAPETPEEPGTTQTSGTIQIWSSANLQSESEQNEYCKRVLTGKGDGTAEYEMIYCAEHAETAESVRTLLEQAESEEETQDAWQQSIELWTEALNAEYDELFTEATDMEKPFILEERTLFWLQLTCYQDELAERYADDPAAALAKISEQLMNKTADVCYEAHTAPENRIDSYVTGRYTGLADAAPAAPCLRDVTAADTGAKYRENLCERHRITEEAIGALLYDAADNEALANAWKSANQLWLVELDAITNERYLAADAEARAQIAAERVSFGNWLNARETFLKVLYPDKAEIVNEVVTQTIRSRVLDMCGENE